MSNTFVCSTCGKRKPIERRRKGRKQCKDCDNANHRRAEAVRFALHPEKLTAKKATAKEWKQKNRDYELQRVRTDRAKNPEKYKKKSRDYYLNNKEKSLAKTRKWMKDNPEKTAAISRKSNKNGAIITTKK